MRSRITTSRTLLGVGISAALAIIAVFVLAGALGAQGPGELFVDADDALCTDTPAEGAGASGTPFCSIQAAIDFIEETTATGGKVTLRAAVYDEGTITTNHGGFVIRGDPALPRGSIVIQPSGEDDIGLHVTDTLGVCGNLTIEHLIIDGSSHHANGQGILVDDICQPITISDVEVRGWTEEGILFADSSGDGPATSSNGNVISDSVVRDNDKAGIELHNGTGNTLTELEISGNGRSGLSAITETNLLVTDSDIVNNGFHGFADLEGTNTRVEGNAITGNSEHGFSATGPHSGLLIRLNDLSDNDGVGVKSEPGLFGEGGSDTEIAGNVLRGNGASGIDVAEHERLTVGANQILENGEAGVLLDDGAGASIRDNTILDNSGSGIVALDQTNLIVDSNTIDDNADNGVELARGGDNEVSGNSIINNGASGLRADDMVRLLISGNEFAGNGVQGIELFDGVNTVVQGSDILNNDQHGIAATRELALTVAGNTISDNDATGIRLIDGTNGRVTGNAAISDNGTEGSAEDYGISINGESNLLIEKNTLKRNFDAQILVNSSSDVQIQKNDLESAGDGIVLVDQLAHPFVGLVIGGSAGNGNRFRGLDPATNVCRAESDACYVEIPQQIVGKGTIDATYNDWGTTNVDLIENLICHAGEAPCGLNTVDFSHAQAPGDSPTEKDTTPAGLLGDVDCNGAVNSIDAALILQHTAGLLGSLPCGENADASGDGNVNAVDAALVLQFSAGLLQTL